MHHSFDIGLATKYGIEEAIIIHHFYHWIGINQRLKRNFHDGRTWTYQTLDEIAAHFPYLSRSKVFNIIEKLCLGKDRQSKKKDPDFEPILIKGNFNKSTYDRTVWYAFAQEPPVILQNCNMDIGGLQNGYRNIATPIPDTKTDTKISPPLLSPPKPEPSSKKSLRSEEEEISPYKILKDCPLTQKEKVRLTKAYSKEQVEKAISVSKKQKVKKSFMGLMLAILKNPEDWPGMIQDEDVNFEQNLAFKYNERLKKMYPKLYSENKKLIKNNVVKLVTSAGVEQISLASSYAQNDIQSAELFLR